MQVAQNIIHPYSGAWKCNEFRTSSIPILTSIYHPLVNHSHEIQQAQISSIQMLSALKGNKLRTSSIQTLGFKTATSSKYHPSGSPQYQKASSSQYHPFQCACQYIIHFYDYSHENGTNSDIIHHKHLWPWKCNKLKIPKYHPSLHVFIPSTKPFAKMDPSQNIIHPPIHSSSSPINKQNNQNIAAEFFLHSCNKTKQCTMQQGCRIQ